MGPRSVVTHVSPRNAFLDHFSCFGLLWIGKSRRIPAGVMTFVAPITRPPYARRLALLSACIFPSIPECPFTHANTYSFGPISLPHTAPVSPTPCSSFVILRMRKNPNVSAVGKQRPGRISSVQHRPVSLLCYPVIYSMLNDDAVSEDKQEPYTWFTASTGKEHSMPLFKT